MTTAPTPPPVLPSQPAKPARKPTPRFHPIAATLAGVSLLLAIIRALRTTGGEDYHNLGFRVGAWVGSMLFSCLVGYIAFLIARRSQRVFNITFCLFAGILVLGNSLTLLRGAPDPGALNEFQHQASAARERRRQEAASGEIASPDAIKQDSEAMAASLERAAEKSSSRRAAALRAGAEVTRRIQAIAEPYTIALAEWQAGGGLSPVGLTREVAQQRIKKLDELARLHAHFQTQLADIPAWYGERCRAHGLSESEAAAAVRGYQSPGIHAKMLRMHEHSAELFAVIRQILTHLRDTHGRWTFDEQADGLVFDVEAEADKYNQLFERMNELAAAESAIQQEILNQPDR